MALWPGGRAAQEACQYSESHFRNRHVPECAHVTKSRLQMSHQRDSSHKGQRMEAFHQHDHFGENREMGPVTLKSVSKTNRIRDLTHL